MTEASETGLAAHALVIGVNDYTDGISALQSAVGDAQAVGEVLASQHGYAVTTLCDAEASAEAILRHLTQTLPQTLKGDSAFLLYFAGHGVALGDGTDGPQGYLLPHGSQALDEHSWIAMAALREAIEQLPCRHLLVVLDCCFAGSFRWAASRGATFGKKRLYKSQLERYLKGDAWLALTSASHEEKAADVIAGKDNRRDAAASTGHSPFAAALLRGLAGDADSARGNFPADGVITSMELYQYIVEELMPADAAAVQTPGIWPMRPGNTGEFVFMNPTVALNTDPDPPLTDDNNPWLGLRTYDIEHEHVFFGRQRVIDALLDAVLCEDSGSLVSVVGASGTGKSSVVKAGLLPMLTSPGEAAQQRVGQWTVITAGRLGRRPAKQLDIAEQALAKSPADSRTLLLIDQFEELYTQCPDQEVRDAFLQRLRALIDDHNGLTVVVTLRTDFEPQPANASALVDLWQGSRFLVPPFNADELREVIEGPAGVMALFFEPEHLIGQLLDEVVAMPGALPLLSFALAEMYREAQRRRQHTGQTDRAIMQEDYDAIGGVVGALHKRATAIYAEADTDADRDSIRKVFLRLINQDGTKLTRRRVRMEELQFAADEQPRIDRLIRQYVDGRLLVVDEGFVEPAHDTLVVAWQKLQEWQARDEYQPLIRAAWRDAGEWRDHRADKSAKGLLWDDDPRLPQLETAEPELNALERDFLQASTAQKKTRRRMTRGITAAVIAALSIATIYAFGQAEKAAQQAQIAVEQRDAAEYALGTAMLEQARQELARRDHFAAAQLAGRAIGFRGYGANGESAQATHNEMVTADKPERESLIKILTPASDAMVHPVAWLPLGHAVFNAAGDTLVGLSADGAIEIRRDGIALRVALPEAMQAVNTKLVISDSGKWLAAFSRSERRFAVWQLTDIANITPPAVMDLADYIFDIAFDPSERKLAVTTQGSVLVWPLQDAGIVDTPLNFDRERGGLRSATFSPDGNALVYGGWHNTLGQFDLRNPRVRSFGLKWTRWPEHVQKGDHVMALEFSRSGAYLAAASANRLLLDVTDDVSPFDNGKRYFETRIMVRAIAFNPREDSVAIASDDEVVVLAVPSLAVITRFVPDGSVRSLSYSADGDVLAYGDSERTEFRFISTDSASSFMVDEDAYPASNTGASRGDDEQLRAFVNSDRFDCWYAAGRFDREERSDARCEFEESETYFAVMTKIGASIRFIGQRAGGNLATVGISKFSNGLGREIQIDSYDTTSGLHLKSIVLPEEQWGIDDMHYGVDNHYLYAKISNFDGYLAGVYRWPSFVPDLTVYENPAACQAPVNLPATTTFQGASLLFCTQE